MPARYLATGHVAGEQCSSTYEGRYISLEENLLVHPYHADGFVDHGDPVLSLNGDIVGVAMTSAAAATDIISIDTEGIWFLKVLGAISDQTSDGIAHALAAGDRVYFRRVPATNTWALSGEVDAANFAPFGYVLGDVSASITTPTVVAVKVHNTPNMLDKIYMGSSSTLPATLDPSGTNRQSNWIKTQFCPSRLMVAGEQIQALQLSITDTLASTGGSITAAEFKVKADNAANDLDGMFGLKLGVTNTQSLSMSDGVYAIAITMGGAGGAPATRAAFQIRGDGTAGTDEGWFATWIASGLGLKADVRSLALNTSHEIPIIIDGTKYCIPVIAWN
jgi:hypothetical protein